MFPVWWLRLPLAGSLHSRLCQKNIFLSPNVQDMITDILIPSLILHRGVCLLYKALDPNMTGQQQHNTISSILYQSESRSPCQIFQSNACLQSTITADCSPIKTVWWGVIIKYSVALNSSKFWKYKRGISQAAWIDRWCWEIFHNPRPGLNVEKKRRGFQLV